MSARPPEQDAANDDGAENIYVDCAFSFEELMEALRETGAEITRYASLDREQVIEIAND